MKPLRHLTLLLIAATASLPAVADAAEPVRFYVATNGNDAWSGRLAAPNAEKTDGPFATLTRARDEIRKLKAAGRLGAGVTVLVRAGSYCLDKPLELTREDSGTAQAPIVYRVHEKEQVTLIGGREVTGFAPYANSKMVVQCSVKAWEIERLAPVSTDRYAGDVPGCELFFDAQRMNLARWPNRIPGDPYGGEWTYVASVPERGSKTAFTYYGDRPRNWSRADEAQVHIFPGPN
ncbi:MAG: hypothetical protein FJ388_25530, partial [Verrucomicrobia bacterium]|nr:hypothetical protein [Verrucomicrobiota bacterium]